MRLKVDSACFFAQRERYDLRFCCEDCAHFVAQRCAHFWPTHDHRRARYAEDAPRADELEVIFCKEFELR